MTEAREREDAKERALARGTAVGLPALTVASAAVMGVTSGVGTALLVLAGGALVGVVMLLWSSLRLLSGEAPVDGELTLAMAARRVQSDSLSERKRIALRALKDLEHEHSVGKIDDADYAELAAQYREIAKTAMREMDHALDDRRVEAERLAAAHLAKRGLGPGGAAAGAAEGDGRLTCPGCGTSNEVDAAFCKKCGKPTEAP